MTSNELIDISVDIGAALLENGAEIYRVEESIARICYAYGATETNIYAVPTAIIASFVRGNSHPVTRVLRIYRRGTNLGRLDQLNTLCREICATSMTYAQIRERLVCILRDKPFHRYHLCLATGGIGFFFTLLFHGSIPEAICSLFTCIILWGIMTFLQALPANLLFTNIIGGTWVATCAVICWKLHVIETYRAMIIGSIMFLVPGLPMTNAIRDLIAGDIMAGICKFTEALLVAVGIAVGVALPLGILAMIGG